MNEIKISTTHEEIAALPLFGTHPLRDNPFCEAQLELTQLTEGLEFLSGQAQIFQDLQLQTSSNEPALMLSAMLSGQCEFQTPNEPDFSLIQNASHITLAYHPETDDVIYCPKQNDLNILAYSITPNFLEKMLSGYPLPKAVFPILDNPDETTLLLPNL